MDFSLAKNSLISLTANMALAISNWLLLVIITKFYSVDALGMVVLALSFLSPLFLFSSFKLRTLVVVDLQGEYSLSQYFNARLVASTLALVCVPLLWWVAFSEVSLMLIMSVAVYKWADAWCDICFAYQHRIENFKHVARSQLTRAIAATSVLVISSLILKDLHITLVLWSFTMVCVAVLETFKVKRTCGQNNAHALKLLDVITNTTLWRVSFVIYHKYWTMSVALVMTSLFIYLPNIVLQHYSGLAAAGQFAAVSYGLVAGSLMITSIAQVAAPRLNKMVQKGDMQSYFRLVSKLCSVGLLLGAAGLALGAAIGKPLLGWVYTKEFSALYPELLIILAAAMVRYSYIFLGTAMNSFKYFHYQTQIYVIGTVCVLIGCLALVPNWGTHGAAWAMLIATCVECVLFILRFSMIRKSQLAVKRAVP